MPPTQTQNRKDLLQAYRLMTQRTALALIAGEPDSANQPLRRRNTATVSGVLVGVIACVVFGVMGIISHGGAVSRLTASGTLTIDSDTATAYVPCDKNAELCPALNYASARLALQSANPTVRSVHQKALAAYKIGPTIGIAGLPEDLPTSSNLIKGPWSVCIDGSGVSTLIGGKPAGGTPLTGSQAALVQANGQDWVVYQGSRFMIRNDIALKIWSQNAAQPVSPALLNTLPEGPPFTAPAVPGNQVDRVSSPGSTQYFVREQDGQLHSVTQLQASLIENQPGAPGEQQLSPGQEGNPGSPVPSPPGLPAALPATIQSFTSSLCVAVGSGAGRSVTVNGPVPVNATPTGNHNPAFVSQVWLPQGSGALIGQATVPGQPASQVKSWALLDGATRYGLEGPTVASFLGYNLQASEVVLPASLVGVLPEGKGLDPNAAVQSASG